MTLADAIEAVRQAGACLHLDDAGPVLRGHVDDDVVATLRQHRERVVAVLRLRRLHEAMGFDADDVAMIEVALVSGKVGEVVIVAGPGGLVA
jgi:hypothetical protein